MVADVLDSLYAQHLQLLRARTDLALAAAGFEALVVHAGLPPTQFLDDQDYPFKVIPHFKAWVPILDNPRCLAIHVPGRPLEVLFYQADDYWHKPAALPSAPWTRQVRIVPMANPAQAAAHWQGLGRTAFIGPREAFPDIAPDCCNPPELLTRLHYARAVKSAYELECLRRASALGARGHQAALAAFRRGASEYEAHMQYLQACQQREEEMPYNNIVAFNEHAAILHYQHLERRPPAPLRSFLIDAGAQYRGYAADITRSYAAAPGRFAELIGALDAAQRQLCAEVRPGRDFRDIHLSAHRLVGDVLQRAGVTRLPGEAALERGVTSVFFPHGIGHLLGLQVHDVGGVLGDAQGAERQRPAGHPYLRLTRMLEPGVVVTIEPGIYFIDSLLAAARADGRGEWIDWTVVEELRPCGGIRIEDNVATTDGEPENLTRDAFSRDQAVAAGGSRPPPPPPPRRRGGPPGGRGRRARRGRRASGRLGLAPLRGSLSLSLIGGRLLRRALLGRLAGLTPTLRLLRRSHGAVDQLHQRHVGRITRTGLHFQDAGITAGARLEARTEIAEQLVDHRLVPQTRKGDAALGKGIHLRQRDQRFHHAAQLLGLRHGGADGLVAQERGRHVAHQRMAVGGITR